MPEVSPAQDQSNATENAAASELPVTFGVFGTPVSCAQVKNEFARYVEESSPMFPFASRSLASSLNVLSI